MTGNRGLRQCETSLHDSATAQSVWNHLRVIERFWQVNAFGRPATSGHNLHQHLAHRSLTQPRKSLFHLAERKYPIHHRALAQRIEPRNDLIPTGSCFLGE